MIIVKLMGGLGNQMFQYAAARRLAHRHGVDLKLDLSFLEDNAEVITKRNFELGQLNIKAGFATRSEVSEFARMPKHALARILRMFTRGSLPERHYVKEPSFNFSPMLLQAPDNSYLDGYWQTERYFIDISEMLRDEFENVTEPDQWNMEMAERIASSTAVSIHVRRGDYVSDSTTNQFHGTCSLEYYRKAVAKVTECVSVPTFFVFSDDPAWVNANLHLPNAVYMGHNPPDKGCEDLRLMKLCKHHIIANSSFSWWGAWLGSGPDQIVIAPRKWFNAPEINTEDLTPGTWHRL